MAVNAQITRMTGCAITLNLLRLTGKSVSRSTGNLCERKQMEDDLSVTYLATIIP